MIDAERAAAWLAEGEKLSANALSERIGKTVRVIQGWFKDGLPHETDTRRGQPVRLTTLRAIREYARLRGLRLHENAAPGPGGEGAGQREAAEAPLIAGAVADFETRVEAEVRRRLEELVGDPAYDERIVRFRDLLSRMFRIPQNQIFEAAEQNQAATALKNASAELRQLEAWAVEARKKRGELLEKAAMLRSLSGLTDVIASARDSVPPDIARAVADAVGRELAGVPGVSEGVADRAARSALAAAEREVAKAFDRVADAVKARGEAIE